MLRTEVEPITFRLLVGMLCTEQKETCRSENRIESNNNCLGLLVGAKL